jgi:ribonuclease PH
MSPKRGSRPLDSLRSVEIIPGFHHLAEGSVLYRAEGTVVLVTASVDDQVPEFMKGRGEGWITAEYQMHPRSNPVRRERRDGREKPLGGRSKEIERLIGRALRAAVHRNYLGERQIVIDCDVLEADGGTRTAAVTAGWMALALALNNLRRRQLLDVPVLRDQVAAVSVGYVDGKPALDLCYAEDCAAHVDMNIVATANGSLIELQGTAEKEALPRAQMDELIDLGLRGTQTLCALQREVLANAGVTLERVLRV